VLLIPVVLLVSRRTGINVLKIGIPALAGLSVLHGLVPPHPGPLVAIDALGADLGTTLAFGLLIAIPTVIVAGPVFGNIISRYIVIDAPRSLLAVHEPATVGASRPQGLAPVTQRGSPSRSSRRTHLRPLASAVPTSSPPC
jgi:GntP family gluconate:H+ symporter